MIDFATKLKGMRELRGWSQEELAKRLRVSRSKIGNYEQGIREPDFESLEAIADVFNCPVSYLIADPHPVIPQITMNYAIKLSNLSARAQAEVMNYIDFLEEKEKRLNIAKGEEQ